MQVLIYFDGACLPHNPNGICTYGYVIKDAQSGDLIAYGKGISAERGTNNLAEYLALIKALEKAKELNIQTMKIFGDNLTVINQVNGTTCCKNKVLIPYNRLACNLIKKFKSCKLEWIPREQNREADELSVKAFIEHIETKNLERALKIKDYNIKPLNGNNTFLFNQYKVELNPPSCQCEYFTRFNGFHLLKKDNIKVKCKHILLIEKLLSEGIKFQRDF